MRHFAHSTVLILSLFLLSCSNLIDSLFHVEQGDLYPGQEIRYSNPGGGTVSAYAVDEDSDGEVDGIDFDEDGDAEIAIQKVKENEYSIDVDGDGSVEGYLFIDESGNPVFSSQSGGNGTRYRVVIIQGQFAGFSLDDSDDADVVDPDFNITPPSIPSENEITAMQGQDSVLLFWEAASDDSTDQLDLQYEIYRSQGVEYSDDSDIRTSSNFRGEASGGGTQISFTDTGLTSGTYYYYVFAVDTQGNFARYANRDFTPDLTPPTIVSNTFVVEYADATSANLTWELSSDADATSYEYHLYFTLTPLFNDDDIRQPGNLVASLGSTATSYLHGGRVVGQTYFYYLYAEDSLGNFIQFQPRQYIHQP